MSCCKRKEVELYIENNCVNHDDIHTKKCSAPDTQFCLCRSTAGCSVPTNCNTLRPINVATIETCLEACQCAEEVEWNCYTPPKPSCKWLNNFCELRRQWSYHARQQNCKCCNCNLRISMIHDVMNPVSTSNTIGGASHTYTQTCSNGWKKENMYNSFISYIGSIGYTSLVPGPLALFSFMLLIFITIGLSSSLIIYQHCYASKTYLKRCG